MMTSTISPRQKVLDNLKKLTQKDISSDDNSKIVLADPGKMRLYSFYEPALKADTYTIHVSQKIDYPRFEKDTNGNTTEVYQEDVPLDLSGDKSHQTEKTQTFKVIGPQFAIEDKDIHSCYPPQGHADQPNVLPHIVSNDPHLPWRRPIREASQDDEDTIPWLAVFPFDCNGPNSELRLTEDQLKGSNAIYQKLAADGTAAKIEQSTTFTLSMTLEEYMNLPKRVTTATDSTPVHIPAFSGVVDDPEWGSIKANPVEVIFLSAQLFKAFFSIIPASNTPDIAEYRFLSHVRNVNTSGMASSGVDDTGIFSIIHSKRTGPTGILEFQYHFRIFADYSCQDIDQGSPPRSQAVHMVSLEFVDQMDATKINDGDLVAFISLHRWTYLCQPPQLVNFVDCKPHIYPPKRSS
jgi:hypothetical protein